MNATLEKSNTLATTNTTATVIPVKSVLLDRSSIAKTPAEADDVGLAVDGVVTEEARATVQL
jgi:hypothetical protein